MAKIVSVNVSKAKGTAKKPVPEIELVPDLGVKNDAHAAPGDRQVSLLMKEDIDEAKKTASDMPECEAVKPGVELVPGSFAENITTEGIELPSLPIGQELIFGDGVRLRVSKIGKECHRPCAIYYKMGDCIMPKRGIFCEVVKGGVVRAGDTIEKG